MDKNTRIERLEKRLKPSEKMIFPIMHPDHENYTRAEIDAIEAEEQAANPGKDITFIVVSYKDRKNEY